MAAGAEAPRRPCLRAAGDGTLLDVSVVPNARRTGCDGLHGDALRVRLAAPPVDGKANDALVAWLADALGCPRRAVRLVRGESARRKQLAIALAPAAVGEWLERELSASAAPKR